MKLVKLKITKRLSFFLTNMNLLLLLRFNLFEIFALNKVLFINSGMKIPGVGVSSNCFLFLFFRFYYSSSISNIKIIKTFVKLIIFLIYFTFILVIFIRVDNLILIIVHINIPWVNLIFLQIFNFLFYYFA